MKFPIRITIVSLMIGCCLGIYLAMCWLIGDIYSYKVRHVIEKWQVEQYIPQQDETITLINNIDTALFWESNNPDYLELKARILYYRAIAQGLSDKGLEDIRQAKELHKKAIKLRPLWPYSYANLVLMKALLGEFDSEYSRALSKAVKLGPWEPSVNLTLAQAAAISWHYIMPAERQIHAQNIQLGIERNLVRIKAILENYQQKAIICTYLRRNKQQKIMCN